MLCTAAAAVIGGYFVKAHGFHVIFMLMFLIQLCDAVLSLCLLQRSALKSR